MIPDIENVITKLDGLLAKRVEEWPIKNGSVQAALKPAMSDFTEYVWRNSDPADLSLAGELTWLKDFMARPIFIGGHMKSGTSLLLQLFDNHPDLIVGVNEGRILKHLVNAYALPEEMFIRKWVAMYVNPTGRGPFWLFGKEPERYIEFARLMRAVLQSADFIHSMNESRICALAILQARRTGRRPVAWVDKNPSEEFRIDTGMFYWPNAKFIISVRHPYDQVCALRKSSEKRQNKKGMHLSIAPMIAGAHRQAIKAVQTYPDNCAIVLYEDLTSHPEKMTRKIMDFLDIEWDECLRTPTVDGKLVSANSMRSNLMTKGTINKSTSWRANAPILLRAAIGCLTWFPHKKAVEHALRTKKRGMTQRFALRN